MKKKKEEAKGTMNAVGEVANKNAAGTGEPENSRDVKKLADHKAKNEKINAERIVNKAIEDARKLAAAKKKELLKLCEEKNAVMMKEKNKSKVETERIIEEGAANGVVI